MIFHPATMMPQRGEIWWIRLDPTIGSEIAKTRPCVILTTNILNERRRTIVVIPLSTSPRASPPVMVPVTCSGRSALAAIDQIRAVSTQRLEKRIGLMTAADLETIEDSVRQVLELGD